MAGAEVEDAGGHSLENPVTQPQDTLENSQNPVPWRDFSANNRLKLTGNALMRQGNK
jgi:hypothetical protein